MIPRATSNTIGSTSRVYVVEGIGRLRQQGSKLVDRVKAVVVIEVQQALPLVSPAYDDGTTSEAEMVKTFEARFARLLERFRGL